MIISWHQTNCCHTQKLKRLIPRQSWHLAILAIVCRVCELSFLSLFLSVSSFVNWKLVSCCGLSHPARLLSLLMHCWRLWPNCWHMLRMFEFCSFPSAFHLSIYACSIVVPQNFHHTREHKLHTQTQPTTSFTDCHWHIQLAEKCLSTDNVSYEWYMQASRAHWDVSNLFTIYQQLLLLSSKSRESTLKAALAFQFLDYSRLEIRFGKSPEAVASLSHSLSFSYSS